MFDLNFLPDSELKAVKRSLAVLIVRNVLVWILFVGLVSVILLVWSKYFLESSLADSQERSILVSGSNLTLTEQIENINAEIAEVEDVQEHFVPWSEVVVEIVNSVPGNSRVSELLLNAKAESFTINGETPTRDDLLALEESLDNNPYLENIESPISNILVPKDILFQFSGDLILEPVTEEEE